MGGAKQFILTTAVLSFARAQKMDKYSAEVAGVTFSDSAPVPKFFNPGPVILQL